MGKWFGGADNEIDELCNKRMDIDLKIRYLSYDLVKKIKEILQKEKFNIFSGYLDENGIGKAIFVLE